MLRIHKEALNNFVTNYAFIPCESPTGDPTVLTVAFRPSDAKLAWATHKSRTLRAAYLVEVCAKARKAARQDGMNA